MATQMRDLNIAKIFKGRDGIDKTSWIRVGRMSINSETGNISIFLDVYPAHGEVIMAFKPKPKPSLPEPNYSQPSPPEDLKTFDVDEIPF